MELEFEIEKTTQSRNNVYYTVKRKGLEVGTLVLDADPYAKKEAEKKQMVMK